MQKTLACGLVMALSFAAPVVAQEKQKTIQLPDLTVGLGDAGYGVSAATINMEAGKPHRMWLKATGKKECAFQADEFMANIKWRKIEVSKVELKPSATMKEIEFEQEGSAELFFTPTKAGEYTWICKGVSDKGLTGKFIVK
jgi:uncharacterized cupredoxin-like copper-binding protein